MEKQQYILKLPLKQMALRNVAISLWSGADIINLVKHFRYQTPIDDFHTNEWQSVVENKVMEKISLLVLPQAVRKELMHAIEPIGPEILKWKIHHESLVPDVVDFLSHLRWTSVGTVDYRETAKTLMKQARINIIDRYQLACVYCLDDYLPLIWEELNENVKKNFVEKCYMQATHEELVAIWTRLLIGDKSRVKYIISRFGDCGERTLFKYAFVCAAQIGNKHAAQYFFEKLTDEEKENSLFEAAQHLVAKASTLCIISFDFPKEKFCDTLCFLLSQMNEEEQMKVFAKDAYTCLRCFLNWPWQDLFIKVAGVSWEHLSKEKYRSLIAILASGGSISGCHFQELFGELFLHAPSDYRKFIHWETGLWFRYLFFTNDTESIKLVLRHVDSSDKERFVIGERGFVLCRKLVENGKWFILEVFIAECHLSKEARSRLKVSFKRFFACDEEEPKWKRFFHLIDTANVENYSKRSSEDLENDAHFEQMFRKKRRIIF